MRVEITIFHALYNRLDLGLSVTASDSDSFCRASSSTSVSRIIYLIDILIRELLNVDLHRDLLAGLLVAALRCVLAQPHWLDSNT